MTMALDVAADRFPLENLSVIVSTELSYKLENVATPLTTVSVKVP